MSVAESLHQRTARRAKVILREWIYQRIDGEDEITVEELVADAYRDLQQDEEFLEALLADGIALLIPPLAIQIWSNDRAFVQTATGAISGDELERRVAGRFARWMEHVGDGQHKSLLTMTRTDLAIAIEGRSRRVRGEMQTISFLSDIEGRLKGGATVGSKFKEADLDALWRKHFNTEPQTSA